MKNSNFFRKFAKPDAKNTVNPVFSHFFFNFDAVSVLTAE